MAFKKQWATNRKIWTPAAEPFAVGSWYDCADTSTFIYGSGNEVEEMADKWGYEDVFAFISAPEANIRTLNGLNVLDFVTPDRMQNGLVNIGTSGDHIAIGVFQIDVITNQNQSIYSFDGDTSNIDYQVDANVATQFNGRLNNFGTNIQSTVENSGPSIYCCVWDKTAGTKSWIIDGVNIGTLSDYDTLSLEPTMGFNLMINRGNNQTCDGILAEFLWGEDDISDTFRQKVEGYLAYKWGLRSNLPADHPYKYSPPRL